MEQTLGSQFISSRELLPPKCRCSHGALTNIQRIIIARQLYCPVQLDLQYAQTPGGIAAVAYVRLKASPCRVTVGSRQYSSIPTIGPISPDVTLKFSLRAVSLVLVL